MEPAPERAVVVVLAGPSGGGKTRLAGRLHAAHGWPVVRLDDFYRDGDDPSLPTVRHGGGGDGGAVPGDGVTIVDWDDPRSWDGEAALAALTELVDAGAATVPVYDLRQSRAVGTASVRRVPGQLVVAEGIFAAELIGALRDRGLLHSAWCICQDSWVTFARRLVRDLSERRKPPGVLWRRGNALRRAQPDIVERMEQLGARRARPAQAERALR